MMVDFGIVGFNTGQCLFFCNRQNVRNLWTLLKRNMLIFLNRETVEENVVIALNERICYYVLLVLKLHIIRL